MTLIKTFLYFAIFKHPLTREEAQNFCQHKTDSIDEELQALVDQNSLFKLQEFYLPFNNPEWVERRIKGNQMAERKMATARRMGNILNYFPFVRAVMISGSLSKGYMDKDSDIDFFVIMKPGNIAISKVFMGLFRRFFARKSCCTNFIIDANHLEIKKKNLYTAIEMATLIPVVNAELSALFMSKNVHWVRKFLPNVSFQEYKAHPVNKTWFKRAAEYLLSTSLATRLNDRFQQTYIRRSGVAYEPGVKQLDSGDVTIGRGVIKLHKPEYHTKIMSLYKKNQEDFVLSQAPAFKRSFYD